MKRVFVGFGAACVLALCAIGIVLVVRVLHQQAVMRAFIAAGPANLAREEAAARQEGIPLSAAQLQRPLPPPSQNAAPLYVKLTKLLHDKPLGLPKYAEGMDAFHSYTPEQIAVVRQLLATRQDVMTLIYQAADRPKCVFVRDWKKVLIWSSRSTHGCARQRGLSKTRVTCWRGTGITKKPLLIRREDFEWPSTLPLILP